MRFSEIFTAIIGAILGSFMTHWLDKKQKSKNEKNKKFLTNQIIIELSPERNFQKVEELLGTPDKIYDDYSVLDDIEHEKNQFTSVLYYLDNAELKITTKDKQSIFAITVLTSDTKIVLPFFGEEINSKLMHDAKISEDLIENHNIKITPVRTIRDYAVLVTENIGPPFYKSISYFCIANDDNDVLNSSIFGFSFSSQYDTAFYIHDYELRKHA